MNNNIRTALEYVRNTNGGATRAHFFEDHEPVGQMLWRDMDNAGYVRTDENGRIHLTGSGIAALKETP